jgi:heme o synthase
VNATLVSLEPRLRAFLSLCKLRVNSLILFTAVAGMLLARPTSGLKHVVAATAGIGLVAFAAAAINCLLERSVDARMTRTQFRPLARGDLRPGQALGLSIVLGGLGLSILHVWVNDLTLWLTLATFLGYAVVYTVYLKPATPMNVVIGGGAGAMPPVLGWAAMTGQVTPEALALFLVIFLWTPPHFWALCMARRDDYTKAGFPMLPVTHGIRHTCRQVVLYVTLLNVAALLPVLLGMQGIAYAIVAITLGAVFLGRSIQLWRKYSDAVSWRLFRYSITYLATLFCALLVDRLARLWLLA